MSEYERDTVGEYVKALREAEAKGDAKATRELHRAAERTLTADALALLDKLHAGSLRPEG